MNEDLNSYKTIKLVHNIMFNFCENDYSEDPSIFNLLIIESFKNIVHEHLLLGNLSNDVKNNIYNFLRQAREYKDENSNKRYELVNEIIMLLNSNYEDKSEVFYRMELYKRTRDFKYVTKYTKEQINENIEYVHDSICNDFYILVSHLEETTDEEFEEIYLPCFTDTETYYDSLNAILLENPKVFKNKLFYSRMLKILNANTKIHNDDKVMKKYNSKMLRKINRKVRKV